MRSCHYYYTWWSSINETNLFAKFYFVNRSRIKALQNQTNFYDDSDKQSPQFRCYFAVCRVLWACLYHSDTISQRFRRVDLDYFIQEFLHTHQRNCGDFTSLSLKKRLNINFQVIFCFLKTFEGIFSKLRQNGLNISA